MTAQLEVVLHEALPILRRKLGRRTLGGSVNGLTDEDICQMAAEKSLEYERDKGCPPPCAAYVVQIGLNARYDAARKRTPHNRPDDGLDTNPSREKDPAEEVLNQEQLAKALASLDSVKHGILIRLHLLEGWTHKSIAERLGLPPQTVRNRYLQALRQLRLIVKGSG